MGTEGPTRPIAGCDDNNREITIKRIENAFLLIVGCKSFAFSTWKEASEAIALYFSNPEKAKKIYCRQH